MSEEQFWKIAVEAPIPQALTYSSLQSLKPGLSVSLTLGKRKSKGVVIEQDSNPSDEFKIKSIHELIEERPQLTQAQIDWALWISKYYHYPLGEVFALFFPPLKKKGRGTGKELFTQTIEPKEISLNNDQQKIFLDINSKADFSTHLLWGITGSGKTEIYIELIKERLKKNQTSIVLLPEISLTPQLVSRFRNRLGDEVAVIHSHLTERQKTDQWWAVVDGKKKVLIGARSALFCPAPNLGLIIIDEEHEGSFKQDEHLKYHARDAAIMRGKFENCAVILGSATPSLESWYNVSEGKYTLHSLMTRASSGKLPNIEVIDLKKEREERESSPLPFWLSEKLHQEIEANYKNNLQTALFLNRRGIAQTVLCNSCGFIYQCPNCEISLTLHGSKHLVCHYCQYTDNMSETCPDCRQETIKPLGLGTEQVESDLKTLFPMARILRVDRDEIDSRERLEDFIHKMENHEIDIIVGTQMIAKGLDFEKLTLVGLVLADIGFNIPDFRATERSYQLVTQVSGRAGRHHEGRVVIQTYKPDHPSLKYTLKEDTPGFLNEELISRQELNYPPYTRLACIRISGLELSKVKESAQSIASSLRDLLNKKQYHNTQILGPASAPLLKVRNRFRYQILLKSKSHKELHTLTSALFYWKKNFSRVRIHIDIDPYNLL